MSTERSDELKAAIRDAALAVRTGENVVVRLAMFADAIVAEARKPSGVAAGDGPCGERAVGECTAVASPMPLLPVPFETVPIDVAVGYLEDIKDSADKRAAYAWLTLRHIVAEVQHLRGQRDGLQASNTALLTRARDEEVAVGAVWKRCVSAVLEMLGTDDVATVERVLRMCGVDEPWTHQERAHAEASLRAAGWAPRGDPSAGMVTWCRVAQGHGAASR